MGVLVVIVVVVVVVVVVVLVVVVVVVARRVTFPTTICEARCKHSMSPDGFWPPPAPAYAYTFVARL